MIIISLDEYGEFEKNLNKPMFIGGVIFDDGDFLDEEKIERKRIEAYYRRVIKDTGDGFKYPQDLHSNGNKNRDHNVIKKVKEKVSETLPEFISDGTYKGEDLCGYNGKYLKKRQGKYHLFVMLKSDDGKKRLLCENVNMMAKDDWASNRYFHMASSVVNRIIFHNPIYSQGNMPSVKIDVATRSTESIDTMESEREKQYKKQKYKKQEYKEKESNQKFFYSIMNPEIYRTIISQEMINSGKVTVKIEDIDVKSIQYKQEKRNMEFLYLSDSLCSYLSFKLEGNSADDWLEQIIDRTEKLNPYEDNLLFGYDEIDNDFAKAWNLFENKNIYEALSVTYDAKVKKGKFAEYYKNVWFSSLEKRVLESVTPELFSKSVNDISELLTINNLNQEKLLYLMQQFEGMVERVSGKYGNKDTMSVTLYKLYDAGVTAFSHIGDAVKAKEYYEKCKQYAMYVGVDSYLNTNNKLIVCLEDSFEWNLAKKIAEENVTNQQLLSEIKRGIFKYDSEISFLDEAKSISQLARVYAAQRDENAEKEFRKALEKLEKDSANYKITQSYLLHFYADMGMKEEFDKEALSYFGENYKTYNQRLNYFIKEEGKSDSAYSIGYAIYVLVRGLFCFHREEIDDNLWRKLCVIDEKLKKDEKSPGGHPWEIIYKYLEMLSIMKHDKEAREKFSKLKKECLKYAGATIDALQMFGDAEVAEFSNEYELRDNITNRLVSFLKDNFYAFKKVGFSSDGAERYNELKNYFSFMYH